MKLDFDENDPAWRYSRTFADYFQAMAKRARRQAAGEAKNREGAPKTPADQTEGQRQVRARDHRAHLDGRQRGGPENSLS